MDMNELVNYLEENGFVYQGSKIYGGLSNAWDYGPLGSLLKNNIKKQWTNFFVKSEVNNHLIDASILMNKSVWEASGHLSNFSDPLMDCTECKKRFRADKLIEDFSKEDINVDGWSNDKLKEYITNNKVPCPACKATNFTDIRNFNLMFKTNQGVLDSEKNTIYLRPETAQAIFVNFKNIARTTRAKLPIGVGQIGKSFRNEITPGNFIFRTREFEQMELEVFVMPGEDEKEYKKYVDKCLEFLKTINIDKELIRTRVHEGDELAHYAKATTDIEFKFLFGWGELWGIANRCDFDLKQHQEHSKQDLTYLDQATNKKILPFVIEPSVGVERLFLALVTSALKKLKTENGERTVLQIAPVLAPYKIAILPLIKKVHRDKSLEIFKNLSSNFDVTYDEAGKIGKRYARQDSIGTPFAVTIDDETLTDESVTVRNRDTMEQERVLLKDLNKYISDKL